jgi:alpha-beta hydrolase superfamily lysophospholipase
VPFASGVKINNLVDLYEASLQQENAVVGATLNVEKIAGPVLLLSGGEDEIWPANDMAGTVCERMEKIGKPCQHVNYPDAGHLLDEKYVIGGTEASNAAANKASSTLMLEFIDLVK